MSNDLVKRADRALSDIQGRIDATKLQLFQECIDRIEELEKRSASLEAVLREVDEWVDDLLPYAQEGFEPATVFKRVKEVLNK